MDMLIILAVVLQSLAISLGVGSSTLAVINFFVAIADGTIDVQERKLMGVVYIVLRVAMILILVLAAFIGLLSFADGGMLYFSPFILGMWTLIAMLFLNAFLMTKHIMPSNIGPALQASTWYTLGVVFALVPLGLTGFSYIEFLVGYAAAITLAIAVINGAMSYLKKKNTPAAPAPSQQ